MCSLPPASHCAARQIQLDMAIHFATPIYTVDRPDFIDAVSAVSDEHLAKVRQQPLDEIYPVVMSGSYFADHRVADFAEFVGVTAWNILRDQGYAMEDKTVVFREMWTQEHHKHSAMEQHTHGYGSQIVGFYFLEVPDGASRVVFHDPRVAKTMIDLPQQYISSATISSQMINFVPKPGMFIFTNAWIAHSFTRHASDFPIKFVHFNLAVEASPVEVV